jgi:uncharacterized protein YndB with AHSA1/START domain
VTDDGGSARTEATLHDGDGRPVIRFERILRRPPQEVWRAITDPEELKAWFPCDVEADAWEAGAAVRFRFGAKGPQLTGTVLEADEPRVLAYTWGEETLRFELSPAPGGGTRLVFSDALDRAIAARNAAGWQVCLAQLTGEPVAADAWKGCFERYSAEFEPVIGPQEGPPEGYEEYAR